MKYDFIRNHAGEPCVRLMCRVLSVSHSGYYAGMIDLAAPGRWRTSHCRRAFDAFTSDSDRTTAQ